MGSTPNGKYDSREKPRRQKRIAAGLCVSCGNSNDGKTQMCLYHREKAREHYRLNAEKYRQLRAPYQAEYGKTHALEKCEKQKLYYAEHKEQVAAYKRSIRHIENERKRTPEARAKRNANRRARKRSDPAWGIVDRLRKRIGRAIRDYATGRKDRRTADLIGCPVPELMAYLESKFLPGMTWENRDRWHVDHRRPCVSFDLKDPEQQKLCFHYTNLQPLWAFDNISKHGKWLVAA